MTIIHANLFIFIKITLSVVRELDGRKSANERDFEDIYKYNEYATIQTSLRRLPFRMSLVRRQMLSDRKEAKRFPLSSVKIFTKCS